MVHTLDLTKTLRPRCFPQNAMEALYLFTYLSVSCPSSQPQGMMGLWGVSGCEIQKRLFTSFFCFRYAILSLNKEESLFFAVQPLTRCFPNYCRHKVQLSSVLVYKHPDMTKLNEPLSNISSEPPHPSGPRSQMVLIEYLQF